jgi:hypothetical protein
LLLVLTFFLSWCDRSHRTSVEAALRHYLPWFPTRMGLLSDDVRRKSPWHNIWRCLDRIQKSPFVPRIVACHRLSMACNQKVYIAGPCILNGHSRVRG